MQATLIALASVSVPFRIHQITFDGSLGHICCPKGCCHFLLQSLWWSSVFSMQSEAFSSSSFETAFSGGYYEPYHYSSPTLSSLYLDCFYLVPPIGPIGLPSSIVLGSLLKGLLGFSHSFWVFVSQVFRARVVKYQKDGSMLHLRHLSSHQDFRELDLVSFSTDERRGKCNFWYQKGFARDSESWVGGTKQDRANSQERNKKVGEGFSLVVSFTLCRR